ncbi:hypothetical protein AJY63_05025 [Campylobacter jejuni]|nr:hypothetical protein AJY63_05025 [Campylobacter jejuni]
MMADAISKTSFKKSQKEYLEHLEALYPLIPSKRKFSKFSTSQSPSSLPKERLNPSTTHCKVMTPKTIKQFIWY